MMSFAGGLNANPLNGTRDNITMGGFKDYPNVPELEHNLKEARA